MDARESIQQLCETRWKHLADAESQDDTEYVDRVLSLLGWAEADREPVQNSKRTQACLLHQEGTPRLAAYFVGPGNLDVGHCRLDLALMYGQEVADRFRLWYERMTREEHHPMWDLLSVADRMPEPGIYEPWGEFGLIGLDEHTLRARFEEFTERALSEIN